METPASRKSKKGLVTKVALGVLAAGGIVVALAVAPGLGMALKLIDPNPRKAMNKLERAFRRLVQDGDIEELPGAKERYRLTASGQRKLARLRFAEYSLPNVKRWDGKWRVVCFDIPETEQYARRVFQGKLSELGFYRLQNSVCVYPYSCAGLVELAHEAFELQKHIRVIVADSIDDEARLLHFFKLKR